MAGGKKKKKKSKSDSKRAMSDKRLSAVQRIERASRKNKTTPTNPATPATPAPPAPPATQTGQGKSSAPATLVPRASGKAAELIARAHGLGLSVSVDNPADRVAKLLADFELVLNYVRAVWLDLVGSDFELSGCEPRRLERVVAWIFDDGRMIGDVLQRADKFAAGAPVDDDAHVRRYVISRLREEFRNDGILPKPGLLGRLMGG